MKRLTIILLLFMGFMLSESFAQQQYETPCQSFQINSDFGVEEFVHPISLKSFEGPTALFCSPNYRSERIEYIPFNTELEANEKISRIVLDSNLVRLADKKYYQYQMRYEKWWKVTYQSKVGYVYMDQVAVTGDVFNGEEVECPFLAVPLRNQDWNLVQFKAPVADQHIIQDVIEFPLFHGYRIIELKNHALSTGKRLFCYQTYRESCPGATQNELFLYDNEGFTKLVGSYSTGEMGEYERSAIFLPFKFEGETKLVVLNQIITYQLHPEYIHEVTDYSYPKNLGIPIEELIVKTSSHSETLFDEGGDPLETEDGMYKVNDIIEPTQFFTLESEKLKELGAQDYMLRINLLTRKVNRLNQQQRTSKPKTK